MQAWPVDKSVRNSCGESGRATRKDYMQGKAFFWIGIGVIFTACMINFVGCAMLGKAVDDYATVASDPMVSQTGQVVANMVSACLPERVRDLVVPGISSLAMFFSGVMLARKKRG